MVKILGMDGDGKWHECQPVNTARMQRSCDGVVDRVIAWARADSEVVLVKDICKKCIDTLLIVREIR